jgi:hypothetical protein
MPAPAGLASARMSNVVSPRGPLPPRVYWRRRLVVLALVCGAALLAGRLFGADEDTHPVAGPAKPTAPDTSRPSQAAATPARDSPPGGARSAQPARGAMAQTRSAGLAGAVGPLAAPQGPCAASDVVIAPDVEDADAHGVVPVRLGLSTNADRACTFAFGPDSVAVQVTSGDDLVWESQACPGAVPRRSVVLRPGWLSYVSVDWPGRRSDGGCGSGDFAEPGYYWAEAAAIGAAPEASQFVLEDPPEPEPTQPTPSADTPSADTASDDTASDDTADRDAAEGDAKTEDGRGGAEPTEEPTDESTGDGR